MNSSKNIVIFLILASHFLFIAFHFFSYAADIEAPKMEIIDSIEGRLTVFPQGIIITDKDTKITGKYATFYERDNRAEIYDSVLIENPQFTINADTVFYSFREKTSRLRGNVIVESETLRIETASLIFEQSPNIVTAPTDVKIREKKQRLTILGKKGMFNFSDDNGMVDSEPVLYIERDDTTVVRSRQMILENRQSRFIAINDVSVQTRQTILTCDTLVFYTNQDYGIAQGNPRITEKENLLAGNTIEFYFIESAQSGHTALSHIKVQEQAHATYLTQDGGLLKVHGNEFFVYYEDGEIRQVNVFSDSLAYVTGTFTPKQEL
ncbi:MAG: hypothetical protein KGZ86_08105 [Candidatus Latescibacteria bacterium]|nr:hypothetical protein [Candidatus Latescibacterota bacterium]